MLNRQDVTEGLNVPARVKRPGASVLNETYKLSKAVAVN
jgi:hypothetical protein